MEEKLPATELPRAPLAIRSLWSNPEPPHVSLPHKPLQAAQSNANMAMADSEGSEATVAPENEASPLNGR